jgi:hypothetical protein
VRLGQISVVSVVDYITIDFSDVLSPDTPLFRNYELSSNSSTEFGCALVVLNFLYAISIGHVCRLLTRLRR